MSKLSDRIRNATRVTPQPLGFVAARTASQATMVLAALAPDGGAAADLARRGAEVVIVGSANAPARAERIDGVEKAVLGAWIGGTDEDEAKRFREAGFDFVVFDPDRASATAMLDESIGYVLRLPAELTDIETRALEGFQLDAIDVGEVGAPLTVRRQIDLQRLFALTRKPLMSKVSADISAAELRALRDTNVPVVVVEGGDSVEALRRKIDELPPRSRRKDEDRPLPFVPRTAAVGGEEEHEHDDDDD